MIVAGIDPSLTSTGVAVVDTQDRLTIATHTVASKGRRDASWRERWERGVDLAADIGALVPRDSELVVVEAPTLSQGRQGGHLDRHGLWWALYGNLTRAGHDVLVVAASSRAKFAAGKGNAGRSVGRDGGSVDGVRSSGCSAAVVAWGADDVDVVEADGLAGGVAGPGLGAVVGGELVGAAAVGAEGLDASGSGG